MITLTDSAKDKLVDILAEENNLDLHIRLFVQGGGCSGFTYGFTVDEQKNEDDFEIPLSPWSVLVDSMSLMYLQDAVIDYEETLMGSQFKVSNPNAVSTCGCGSSFSI